MAEMDLGSGRTITRDGIALEILLADALIAQREVKN